MRILALLVFAILFPTIPTSADAAKLGPQPPCGSAPTVAYLPLGAPPAIEVWNSKDLKELGWRLPDCLGWAPASESKYIVALAGSFRYNGTAADLLGRIGQISMLREVRYWSVSDKKWRPLVIDASALSRPDARSKRADFAATEMQVGTELYYWEHDSRSGKVIHRMTVHERSPARIAIALENVTPIRAVLVTLFAAGALQSIEIIERISPGVWGIYLLTRAGEGASALASGHEASYVNRAAAIYRHLVGTPTDEEPPAAP
ncbi:MAG: DUF6675 family protein [Betaproteobacteria bacterium]